MNSKILLLNLAILYSFGPLLLKFYVHQIHVCKSWMVLSRVGKRREKEEEKVSSKWKSFGNPNLVAGVGTRLPTWKSMRVRCQRM